MVFLRLLSSLPYSPQVELTWSRPWDLTRVIFTISRYLPFVGSALTAYGEPFL